jgi:tetratricopeptide (TPR) repeat protein
MYKSKGGKFKKSLKYLILIILILFISILMIFRGKTYIMVKYYYLNGVRKHKSKNISGAISDYNTVLSYDSTYKLAYISKGSALIDNKEFDKAIEMYNKAITLDSDNAQAYAYRGRAYYELKDSANALNDLNKAISLDDKFAYAYYNRGLLKYTLFKEYDSGCADLLKSEKLGYKEAKEIIGDGNCR